MRKLRVAELEDVVTGKEYIKRLRRLYQQLHPVPAWTNPDKQRRNRNGNNGDEDESSDAGDVGEAMDTDDDDHEASGKTMSAQPLARLLQGSTGLTKIEDNTQIGGKRKLRQEVLDIQRLKDVGGNQPVNRPPPIKKKKKKPQGQQLTQSSSHQSIP